MLLLVPRGVAVVAEDELGADARDFAGCGGGLRVAEVAEELQRAVEALGGDGIGRAVLFEFEQVEDLIARGQQPAERVGQRKGYALRCP